MGGWVGGDAATICGGCMPSREVEDVSMEELLLMEISSPLGILHWVDRS